MTVMCVVFQTDDEENVRELYEFCDKLRTLADHTTFEGICVCKVVKPNNPNMLVIRAEDFGPVGLQYKG